METRVIRVHTGSRRLADLTGELEAFCEDKGDGLCSVFAPHATAGLALMEMGSGSEADLEEALLRLLPRDGRYPTPTARPDTVPTICCLCWCRLRWWCRCSEDCRSSGRGSGWCS